MRVFNLFGLVGTRKDGKRTEWSFHLNHQKPSSQIGRKSMWENVYYRKFTILSILATTFPLLKKKKSYNISVVINYCNKNIPHFLEGRFSLDIETFSHNHIDTTINKNKDNEWMFTGFYGELDTQKQHEAWAKLRTLKNQSVSPWLCVGDYNEIMWRSVRDRAPSLFSFGMLGQIHVNG